MALCPIAGRRHPPPRAAQEFALIDIATLFLTHGLMALALWRMLGRDELDRDDEGEKAARRPWLDGKVDEGA